MCVKQALIANSGACRAIFSLKFMVLFLSLRIDSISFLHGASRFVFSLDWYVTCAHHFLCASSRPLLQNNSVEFLCESTYSWLSMLHRKHADWFSRFLQQFKAMNWYQHFNLSEMWALIRWFNEKLRGCYATTQ